MSFDFENIIENCFAHLTKHKVLCLISDSLVPITPREGNSMYNVMTHSDLYRSDEDVMFKLFFTIEQTEWNSIFGRNIWIFILFIRVVSMDSYDLHISSHDYVYENT